MSRFKNLVFGGGGLRCLSYIGVLRSLEEQNLISQFENFAGASAGAIFATMISIGYTHSDLLDFVINFEYEFVKDIQILGVPENFGLDTGQKIDRFLQLMIRRKTGKTDLTFQEHHELTKKRLYINAVCLDDYSLHYFSVDTHPAMPIHVALRMSISLPILISPVRWEDKLFIDGGVLDNLPVALFRNEPAVTLAVCVERVTDKTAQRIDKFETYCFKVFNCIYDELVKLKRKEMCLEKFTVISIVTDGHTAFSFNIDRHHRKKLYRNGYRAASSVLKKIIPQSNGLVQSIVDENKIEKTL